MSTKNTIQTIKNSSHIVLSRQQKFGLLEKLSANYAAQATKPNLPEKTYWDLIISAANVNSILEDYQRLCIENDVLKFQLKALTKVKNDDIDNS